MGSRNLTSDRGIIRLLSDLQSLLEDSNSADLVFFVGGKETPFRSHSFLLRNRCKSFRGETRFPDLNPDVFQSFLHYVYTGKLSVDENGIFELLCVSCDFGMDDLKETCMEILCGNLEPTSACSLLTASIGSKGKGRKGLEQIIDRCIAFIGENPSDCLQTPGFLSLPMESLVAIISSDQLCLEEEEVWRCVLRWAQYKGGVETHVSRWTEDERLKVAKFLSPVISHVRLLLIDSTVFAEEVEPTGCVPMALSLERYRFAALPHQFQVPSDPRLNPRNSPRLFQASSIITNERIGLGRKLNEWFGGSNKQSWRCIYRASLHGYGAESFHNHCDGFAPTYVVALIQNTKWICGGFSDVPWTRSKTPRYAASSKAFLFCYDGNSSASRSEPSKFPIVKKHFALCHDSNSGPIFGAGADLFISSMCHLNSDSYSNLPHSYECESGNELAEVNVLTPSYNFSISDYEVFVPFDSSPSGSGNSTTATTSY